MSRLKEQSIKLAYLLRHDKEYNFPKSGWRTVQDLIDNHGFNLIDIREIVKTDPKNRYELNEDETKIRARQGHSIEGINPGLIEKTPPPILYHGTTLTAYDKILASGEINKMSRTFVQLSEDIKYAWSVGKRHVGCPVILQIDAAQMIKDGLRFYISSNNVWLIDSVPTKYITKLDYDYTQFTRK